MERIKIKNKKQKCIIISIIITILMIMGIIIFLNKNKLNKSEETELNIVKNENTINEAKKEQNNNLNENELEEQEEIQKYENTNKNEIEKIKNEINATANSEIYYVEEEYDGRKILQIKPEVQYDIDLASILKNGKPNENEIKELIAKKPKNTGIWISDQSKEKFTKLLKDNNISNFEISEDGYLNIEENSNNENTKKLYNMTKSNKLYIINITKIAYERDYITGEIIEYPFEDMDPMQEIQSYEKNNNIILNITTNQKGKLTEKEILDAILQY